MSDPAPAVTTEQTLWTGRVSILHYAGKWIFALVLLLAVAGSFLFDLPELKTIFWFGRAALIIYAFLLIGCIQLDRQRRRYRITNKRVSVDSGIINRVSNEVRICDIRSINLQRTGFAGLFGIGRVEFSSAATDEADVIFWSTPAAEKVRNLVRSLQP